MVTDLCEVIVSYLLLETWKVGWFTWIGQSGLLR